VPGVPPAWVRHTRRRAVLDGSLTVFAAVDGVPAGVFLLEDPVRPDAPRMIRALRAAGITRVVLVTGDRAEAAETVGRIVGVDAVNAERDPADKLAIVRAEQARAPTIMVGDGINDAPALAAAGVGVALAARGATASAEAADVVLTIDRIDALADAILIARRSRRIALQAVVAGMGLSALAMAAAAAGYLPPAAGAVLQEVIDVLAIGIALRAVLPARTHTVAMAQADIATAHRLHAQHLAVRPSWNRSARSPTRSPPTAAIWARPAACWTGWNTTCCRTNGPRRPCWYRSWPRPSAEPIRLVRSPVPTPRSSTRSAGCTAFSATSPTRPNLKTSSSCEGCSTASTPYYACTTLRKKKAPSASSPTHRPAPPTTTERRSQPPIACPEPSGAIGAGGERVGREKAEKMALHSGKAPRPDVADRGGNPFATVANPALAQQVAPPLYALADDPVPADTAWSWWHAPDPADVIGCSTTGVQRGGHAGRNAAGPPASRPIGRAART
jgi:soluble P-type ATPase